MSVNKFAPHIFILPEDDANRSIATGFKTIFNTRQCFTVENAGGWIEVIEIFLETYQSETRNNQNRHFVLLLDFDGQYPNRLEVIKKRIPLDLIDRVFVIGILSEPEDLKTNLGHQRLDRIGEILAEECRDNTIELWNHELLKHNKNEINRMSPVAKKILFSN